MKDLSIEESIETISSTFPARGLVLNRGNARGLGHGTTLTSLFPERKCDQCGKVFIYSPTVHQYKRQRYKRMHYFCSYKCMRIFDKTKPDPVDREIENLKKKIEYLSEQAALPPNQREITSGLERMIDKANAKLTTLMNRKAGWEPK